MRALENRKVSQDSILYISVEIVLNAAGDLENIRIIESSGVPLLDRITKSAIEKIGSIPNPPPDLFRESPNFFLKY